MDADFSQFEQAVRDRNELTRIALDCTAFVLRRARELSPDDRRRMLALVGSLISISSTDED